MDKRGHRREYSSAYLRRTYREGKRVRNETVANLSALPEHVVDWIDAGLKGEQLVPAGQRVQHRPVAAARARGCGRGDGAPAGLARPAGAGVPGTRSGAGADHLPGGAARRPSWPPPRGGPMSPWEPISMSPAPPPTRSTPRWTGCSSAKTPSKPSSPPNILGQT